MPVIAMNQETGSQGKFVAEKLAEELGLDIVRHQIIDHVAQKMHLRKSMLTRFLQGKAGLIERWGTDEASLALFKVEEILELAAKGNVIIRGWGATHVLRPIPHIPCVRVGAPFKTRVNWLMNSLGTDDEDMAAEEIRHSDAAHRANMQHQFGVGWGEPMQYDITLNTERLSVATCVEMIKELLKRPEFKETPDSRAKLTNLTLEYHARAALRASPKTADVKVSISADSGKLTMEGIAASSEERHIIAEIVKHVPGVKKVNNKLKVMKYTKMFPSSKT
ncbi:MAG: cytidylate kinase family protein [Gammaproteobacteria bacterium]|nr:cytidylate kinase family protein [Gammaproteobacteria bacterium]MDH3370674.1 cytidylate kinase family protein [Gammaproteobacteria bacterium]MDH3406116.1 cytidylate kinase family protein [Gammaproteobacteria bacterium]MDH3562528.1 cytidylate kinase family protein [Gammaproteobacteria bacterium]MDH5487692.1 cytidylate kinase family protein [Gammaproteobacteria bacterium]